MKRLIALFDGTTMGDEVIVFETNAPVVVLKVLEKISCDVYINGGDYDDVPIWSEVLTEKGYVCTYVSEHQYITPFITAGDWLKHVYPDVSEYYVIENQPQSYIGGIKNV